MEAGPLRMWRIPVEPAQGEAQDGSRELAAADVAEC